MMKNLFLRFLSRGVLALAIVSLSASAAAPKKLLVVTATKGFRHSSIPTAERILGMLGAESGAFTVEYVRGGADGKDDAEVAAKMSPTELVKYDGVVFANTTGDLAIPDKEFFLNWIKSGKAFIGMHSCSDTYHGYPPYIQMLGGEFLTHHAQVGVDCVNQSPGHPATAHLGPDYEVFDEIYLMKNFDRQQVHGLLGLDKHPNEGTPGDYPVAWCKEYGKGRVFYTSLGHREDVWDAEWTDGNGNRRNSPEVSKAYQQHILGGIKWALGLEPGDGKPLSTAAKVSPDEAAAGFKPLFNGLNLDGWHLRREDGTRSWSAQNGMLVNVVPKDGHGTDLVSDKKFWNFTARYDFMVPSGSNSGFYLRGRHEVQILDDYAAGATSPGGNGSIYNHTTASKFVSKKPGEWQTAEVTMVGFRVTLILNGEKVIDNALVDRPTGSQLDNNVNEPGAFFLQGDHGSIAFRNLRVKELP
ncbi:MAG: ThuA domain-containing protein [Verrucomicrobiales bacterium]|nr:ThuA domain-containing protein [Verrucomicrobiales bacterium]